MLPSTSIGPAVIGLMGVFIGGMVLFVGNNFLARKNLKKDVSLKLAEYRLQWINDLGNEISEFVGASSVLFVSKEDKDLIPAHRDVFRIFSKSNS